MDQRRKRVSLTIFPKVEILKKLQHGSSVKMIQEKYNVGKSTIYDFRSDNEKILQYAAECESANLMKNRKTMKPAKFDELDRVLYEWFKQRRSEGIPISGFILREKAREFHQTMDLEELLLYYIIIIIIFGEKFDYPVNSIIRTGAGPVESGLPSFYCIHIIAISSNADVYLPQLIGNN